MDRSTLRLPDPVAGAPKGERRRCVRQKLHSPVYASFNGPQSGMVVDLSELLDLHEDGFAVQTSERLETNRAVTLCLDLPETRKFIHGTGQVIWSDDAGRGGIRFSALPESSRQVLKEWLFTNLLIACSNRAARTEQLAQREREEEESSETVPATKAGSVVPIFDGSRALSSVEAVRSEVRDIGDDIDAVLQLIAERALSLTGASGAALALAADGKIICRARAGEPAPPLGAPVDVKQGLSGECVRTGLLVSCQDAENDPRIDPEICRTLGISSLIAAPVVSDFRVVGLLEVFSPYPRSFTEAHETVLERLVEMIPKTQSEKTPPENPLPEETQPETSTITEAASEVARPPALELGSMEFDSIRAIREALWEREPDIHEPVLPPVPRQVVSRQAPQRVPEPIPETALTPPSRWLHFGLFGLAIAVVAMVLGYLVGPPIVKRWVNSPQASRPLVAEAASTVSGQSARVKSLDDLRTLADHGDADAQWQMGVRYHDGEGVPQNDVQAALYFQLAADQGHVDAQAHLGAYYWAGRGVPKDLSKAYMWSEIALAGGDENSKARLEGLASQMTQAQVAAARQQAEAWIREHNSLKSASN